MVEELVFQDLTKSDKYEIPGQARDDGNTKIVVQ